VHEIAISSPITRSLLILTACRLFKVRHRRKLDLNRFAGIVSPLQPLDSFCRRLLVPKLDIDISDHVIRYIIAHAQALHLAERVQLEKQVFVEILKELLHSLGVDGEGQAIRAQWRV
jgi:hypothetical protein